MNNPYMTTEDILRTKIPNWDNLDDAGKEVAKQQYYFDIKQAELKEKEQARQQVNNKTRSTYLLLPEYANYRFDKADDKTPQFKSLATKYVNALQDMKRLKAGICFTGGVGVGKTYMLGCMANAIIDRYNERPMMATLSELTSRLLNDSEDNWTWNYAKKCSVLLLDDFGTERQTDWMLEKTFELLDSRTQLSNAVTIVTTNLPAEYLKGKQTDLRLERIYSRFNQLCRLIKTIRGADRRRQTDKLDDILSFLATRGELEV